MTTFASIRSISTLLNEQSVWLTKLPSPSGEGVGVRLIIVNR